MQQTNILQMPLVSKFADMLLGANVTPPIRSTLVDGIETNRAKGGNVRKDTEWRLKFPVTVIKSCETLGEIYKGQERFKL